MDIRNTANNPADDMQEISADDIKIYLKDIENANVAVWRKNRDNQLVVVPVKKLEQYLGEKDPENFQFYIENNWRERIKNYESVLKAKETSQAVKEVLKDIPIQILEKFGRVEEELASFHEMKVIEREEILDDCITELSKEDSKTFDFNLIVKMIDVLCRTLYANHADLEDMITTTDVKVNVYGVFVKSNWIIQILLNLFDKKKYQYNEIRFIDQISTGSKTIDHINKVFLRFLTFCIFFNEYIGEGLFTKDIRGVFKDRYHRYYKRRFPDMEITIEKIFKDGIRRIEKEKELQNYIFGALLFDMGKLRNIKYHDGNDPYNEEIVKKHALYSYNIVTKARQYPFEVMAMSAFHHEYYGGKGSYNFTKPLLLKLTGKKIADENIHYFISYDKDDLINGISLAYFPCKILEIIDVFDALVNKKIYPVAEALKIMKKELIIKSLRIDPILFRIFLEYNVRCEALSNKEMKEIDSIIY